MVTVGVKTVIFGVKMVTVNITDVAVVFVVYTPTLVHLHQRWFRYTKFCVDSAAWCEIATVGVKRPTLV
jgi:hypothetical protein